MQIITRLLRKMMSSGNKENEFSLDPRLVADTHNIIDLPLSRILLMNDQRYPWVILVPRRLKILEIHHLSDEDQISLYSEINCAARLLETEFKPKKLNIGAIGNIVPQLHIHIVARNEKDPAWPGPVWGHSVAIAYSKNKKGQILDRLRTSLKKN
jgi:diadenosine tetraphosphate (Ap4A) HIT family hydrolase